MTTNILIVEDDLLIADMVEERLLNDGFDVCGIATDIESGLALAAEYSPDLAVVDVRLAHGDLGTTLAEKLKQLDNIGILYATGNVDLVTNDESVVGEACLQKPFRLEILARCLRIVDQIIHHETPDELPADLLILNQ